MQKTKPVKNPRKQRKRFFNAPTHLRHKSMSAPLSKELAASRGVRSLPVRKGDTVRIMRGDNKGFEGKVSRVALNEYRIYMEGLTREKVDGTNIFLSIHPSKVQIRRFNMDDKWRRDILSRKKPIEKIEEEKPKAVTGKKAEEAVGKPEKKVEIVEEEKQVEAPPAEKATIEAGKGEALAEEVEETLKETPVAKKARAKKPAAGKKGAKKAATKKEEAPKEKVTEEQVVPAAEEKAPAKKAAKPKAAAKKTAEPKEEPAKKATAKKTAAKPRAKREASKETEGGQ